MNMCLSKLGASPCRNAVQAMRINKFAKRIRKVADGFRAEYLEYVDKKDPPKKDETEQQKEARLRKYSDAFAEAKVEVELFKITWDDLQIVKNLSADDLEFLSPFVTGMETEENPLQEVGEVHALPRGTS